MLHNHYDVFTRTNGWSRKTFRKAMLFRKSTSTGYKRTFTFLTWLSFTLLVLLAFLFLFSFQWKSHVNHIFTFCLSCIRTFEMPVHSVFFLTAHNVTQ
jgi:hypothetical protein